ncbi:AI-2E family transporter [Rhodovulum sp. P5]|uniref:AI-2E family transporter n=1 Tax=Rhodovulum sp. P5 TaxID=1564506 RepID=UPI0009DA5F1F|nr:AI-2E family transporter [Rhodovulum sp. P5]
MRLTTLTHGTALAIMIGWLLWIGKPVLLPVLAAVIAVYILSAGVHALSGLPVLRLAPQWMLRMVVLLGFTVAILLLGLLLTANFARVAAALPRYETNIDALVVRIAELMGLRDEPNWATIRDSTIGRIDTRRWISFLLNSVRGFGGTLFFIVLYASFLFAERMQFASKFHLALGSTGRTEHALGLLERINERIGDYLLVKTTINVILGVLSYLLLRAIGIEFALFWAILIAVLNYIPYFGSLIGVLFPVLLSLAQFGTLWTAALTLVALTTVQVYVGAYLEPRLMGRAFNLSPLVVLLALAFWGTLWGVPGAILAVPLTSSLVIVLAEIPATRPAAIMLSASGKV